MSVYLVPDINSILLFVANTKESQQLSESPYNSTEDLVEIKMEPDDFHHSNSNVSEQTDTKKHTESFELSQNGDQPGENVTGS